MPAAAELRRRESRVSDLLNDSRAAREAAQSDEDVEVWAAEDEGEPLSGLPEAKKVTPRMEARLREHLARTNGCTILELASRCKLIATEEWLGSRPPNATERERFAVVIRDRVQYENGQRAKASMPLLDVKDAVRAQLKDWSARQRYPIPRPREVHQRLKANEGKLLAAFVQLVGAWLTKNYGQPRRNADGVIVGFGDVLAVDPVTQHIKANAENLADVFPK